MTRSTSSSKDCEESLWVGSRDSVSRELLADGEAAFCVRTSLFGVLVRGLIFSNKLFNRGGVSHINRFLDGVAEGLSGLSRRFWVEAGDESDVTGEGTRGVLEPTGTRRIELVLAFIPGKIPRLSAGDTHDD